MVDSIDANRFKVRLNYLSQINEVEFIVAELWITLYICYARCCHLEDVVNSPSLMRDVGV